MKSLLPAEFTDLTPAMRQYAEQKAQVGDAILLFRMGDFYETFYEDAKTISRVLGLTLTSRNKGENPIPLAGIPFHALNSYLRRLVKAGFRVAISEQVEDPKLAKGIVRRDIVRIVTAGTLTEETLLSQQDDNILAALCVRGNACGVALIELASGRFEVRHPAAGDVLDELVRMRPAEVLVDEDAWEGCDSGVLQRLGKELSALCGTTVSRRPPFEFGEHHAFKTLCDHFGVASLAGYGLEAVDISICAAGAIVSYLRETQKTALTHLTSIHRPPVGEFLHIDRNTWRALEIERTLRGEQREGSLLAAINRTVHPGGGRKLRHWLAKPLVVAEKIVARQDAVGAFIENDAAREAARKTLRGMSDIERITARAALGRVGPRDMVGLSRSLNLLEDFRNLLRPLGPELIRTAVEHLGGLESLASRLTSALRAEVPPSIREGGVIADGWDAELDRLRSIGRNGQGWLADYQRREIEATGNAGLKVGFNRVFGYYIEISHAQKGQIPAHYVRRQTVKNAERYITDELKQFETEALTAEERAISRESDLFEKLRQEVAGQVTALQRVADAVATIDVASALADLAAGQRFVRPELSDKNAMVIRQGRHPVLDQILRHEFVPNDTELSGGGATVMIITGPNMAGKSTYIRQVALLTLLAQIGSYVPAEAMSFSIADRLFARVGSADELTRGQSTFMVEMSEAAHILNNATSRSLVVLDEIGRGTSTFDGLSLAWAITEHLANKVGCRTLVATHYHEMTELADLHERICNANVAVREWTHGDSGETGVVFLHRIVPGAADQSYGVHVARLAGVPSGVIERSREILQKLESDFQRQSHGPLLAATGGKRPKQMKLFKDPNEELLRELRAMDVNRMTPLDALQALKGLQDRLGRE